MTTITAPATSAAASASAANANQAPQTARQNTDPAALNQQDFLKLLTTQLQNQDPFAPMENGEFLGQMAQFSTVSGIQQINDTLGAMSSGGGIGANRIATASSLLGHQVLLPGTQARADENGEIHGMVDLPQDAENVRVTFRDNATGAVLHELDLGAQPAGLLGFSWPDLPAHLRDSRTPVRVSVQTLAGGAEGSIGPSVYARVTGVEMPAGSDEINLRVEDYGLMNSLEITALR